MEKMRKLNKIFLVFSFFKLLNLLLITDFSVYYQFTPYKFSKKNFSRIQMANQKKVSLLEFINPSRNYLTLIIALIVLACLAMSIGFGLSSAHISDAQKWLFILFIILFPIFGLILSIWLVLRHFRKLSVSEVDDQIPWQIMSPQKQQRKLNTEVDDLARLLGIPEIQMSDLRSAYIVAEDLALRSIEQEAEISLKRHVSLERTDFDAILINDDVIKCVEITFAITSDISQEKINLMQKKADSLKKTLTKMRPLTKIVLMLVLVTQLDKSSEVELRSNVAQKFGQTPVDVEIRWFDFESLQRTYAA